MEILDGIRNFVALQRALVAALKRSVGDQDWSLLLGVSKSGEVHIGNEAWAYQRHGAGVRFERAGLIVDASRHLDRGGDVFDIGRLIDFFDSTGEELLDDGKPVAIDFASISALVGELERKGEVHRVVGLTGENFRLAARV